METKKTKQSVRAPISEAAMRQEETSALSKLRAQRQVKVFILPDGGDANMIIKINGTRWKIPKGKECEVPEDVYRYIQQKYAALVSAARYQDEHANVVKTLN